MTSREVLIDNRKLLITEKRDFLNNINKWYQWSNLGWLQSLHSVRFLLSPVRPNAWKDLLFLLWYPVMIGLFSGYLRWRFICKSLLFFSSPFKFSMRTFCSSISLFKHFISWVKLFSRLRQTDSSEACFCIGCFLITWLSLAILSTVDSRILCLCTQDLMARFKLAKSVLDKSSRIRSAFESPWAIQTDEWL